MSEVLVWLSCAVREPKQASLHISVKGKASIVWCGQHARGFAAHATRESISAAATAYLHNWSYIAPFAGYLRYVNALALK